MKTILFGAGASIPFYEPSLTTDYLTNKVLELKSWEDILLKYKDARFQKYDIPTASVILKILYQIKSLYEQFGRKINFEQLSEIIDRLSSIEYDFIPHSNMLNLLLHTIGAKPLCLPFWKHTPFLYREIIANAILEMKECPNYNELQEQQQGFIKEIMSHDSHVSVISLNYDECVPTTIDEIKEFDYCFDHNSDRYTNELNIGKFLIQPYVAYFPHGHLRFVYNKYVNVTYENNASFAEELRWDIINSEEKNQSNPTPFAYDFNTFITTGQTKDNAFNNTPFDIYYQRLAKDFVESDTIYIIGYSFGDEHINRLIKSFSLRNETNFVFVIDKYDDEVTMVDEYKDSSNFIDKIHSVFSPKWRIFLDSDAYQEIPFNKLNQSNQEEIDKVNKKGYGKIFDQIVFYKKGYEAFLNEFQKVFTDYPKETT